MHSSSGEDPGFVDDWLGAHDLSRNIAQCALRLSAGVLSKTDLLTVLSRRLGKHLMQTYGLSICELPFASPTIRTGMLSHRRFDNQLAHPGHYRRDSIYR